MNESSSSTTPSGIATQPALPMRAGDGLETIGRLMMLLSLGAGVVGIFAFGRVASVYSWGSDSYQWNSLSVAAVLLSTVWAMALSWAVYRLGTALCWLERIGRHLSVR